MKPRTHILFVLLLFSGAAIGQVIPLDGKWKFHVGDKKEWSAKDFDDQGWEEIKAPSAWEDQGFNGYDGFAWYRRSFDGSKLRAGERYILNLGYIDDTDEVYLNGTLIGVSGIMPPKFRTAYNTERKYPIPAEAINFKGRNVLAIRIFDVVHGGGIVDGALGIYEAPKDRLLVDLQGLWSFSTCHEDQPVSEIKEWEVINVPMPWEQQGHSRYDGEAWYRKSFKVQSDMVDNKNEDYVLLLGKIDDFDRVYINGKLIGKTNDGEPYGLSRSFEKSRVYDIPPGLLKKNELNVIDVWVQDMGNVGGIYEGPVGITTKTAYERYFRNADNVGSKDKRWWRQE